MSKILGTIYVRKLFSSQGIAGQASSKFGMIQRKLVDVGQGIVYNSKVAAELLKEVYYREQLQLPKIEQWLDAKRQFRELLRTYSSGAYKEWTMKEIFQKACVMTEITGFFIIGEIIGRRSIIGYNIKPIETRVNHH